MIDKIGVILLVSHVQDTKHQQKGSKMIES